MSRAAPRRKAATYATDNPVVAVATANPPINPHDDDPLHVHALHVLLFDARLNALTARAANDRALQALLPNLSEEDAESLLYNFQTARRQDVTASPTAFTSEHETARRAFRSARRAVRLERSLTDLVAHLRQHGCHADARTPSRHSAAMLLSVMDKSRKHRIAHISAVENVLHDWPVDSLRAQSTFNVRDHVSALRSRLHLLHAETARAPAAHAPPADPISSSARSDSSQERGSDDLETNPFDPPSSRRRNASSSWRASSSPSTAQPDADYTSVPRRRAQTDDHDDYPHAHPYANPWPPNPHYYYLPPYGHPYGHFPPLYDATPLHFPLTDRLLRDTPSRAARFVPGVAPSFGRPRFPPTQPPYELRDNAARSSPRARISHPRGSSDDERAHSDSERDAPHTRRRDTPRREARAHADEQPRMTERMASRGKRAVSKIAGMVQAEGAGRIASAIVENAPGVPRNVRRMHRVTRAARVMTGREDDAPSGAELTANAVGYMLNRAKGSRSTRSGGSVSSRHSGSGREEGGVGRLASQALGMVTGRREEEEGGLGELASHVLQNMGGGHSGRRNSWHGGRQGRRDSRYGGRHGGSRYGREAGRYGSRYGGGMRYGGRRPHSRGRSDHGRTFYGMDSESEEDEGVLAQAMEFIQRHGGRDGVGADVLSQVGHLMGRRNSRDDNHGGRGEVMNLAMNMIGNMARR